MSNSSATASTRTTITLTVVNVIAGEKFGPDSIDAAFEALQEYVGNTTGISADDQLLLYDDGKVPLQITEESFTPVLGLADNTTSGGAAASSSFMSQSYQYSTSTSDVKIGQLLAYDVSRMKRQEIDDQFVAPLTENEEVSPENMSKSTSSLETCLNSARGVGRSLRAVKEDEAIATLADYFDAVIEATVAGREAFVNVEKTKQQINVRSRRCSILMQGVMAFYRFVPSVCEEMRNRVRSLHDNFEAQKSKTKKLATRVEQYLGRLRDIDVHNYESGSAVKDRLLEQVDEGAIQEAAKQIVHAIEELGEDKGTIDRHLTHVNSRMRDLSSGVTNELSSSTYALDNDEKIPKSKVDVSEAEKLVGKMKENLETITNSVSAVLNSDSASSNKIQLISQMEDMRSDHTNARYTIESTLQRTEKTLKNCNDFVKQLSEEYLFYLLKLFALWDQLLDIHRRTDLFQQACERVTTFGSQLGTLRGLPSAVAAGLEERERRRVFLNSIANDIQTVCQSLYDRLGRENSRRRKFVRRHGTLLPDGLLPELRSWAPEIEVTLKIDNEEEPLASSIPREFSSSIRSARHTPYTGAINAEDSLSNKFRLLSDNSPGVAAADSRSPSTSMMASRDTTPDIDTLSLGPAANKGGDSKSSTTVKTRTRSGSGNQTYPNTSRDPEADNSKGAPTEESRKSPEEILAQQRKYIERLEEANASLKSELESTKMVGALASEDYGGSPASRTESESENFSFTALREIHDCIRNTFDTAQLIHRDDGGASTETTPSESSGHDVSPAHTRLSNTVRRLVREHYSFAEYITKLQDTLSKMSTDLERSISIRDFHVGDRMLFVQLKPPTFYSAFNMDEPHYYLSSAVVKKETPSTKYANRLPAYIVVEAKSIKSFVASDERNPYHLVCGTVYHIVDGTILSSSFSVLPPRGSTSSTTRQNEAGSSTVDVEPKQRHRSRSESDTDSRFDTTTDEQKDTPFTMKRALSLPANIEDKKTK
eukprot:gb/GECG01004864.1/.p1 GENE.gb/GECG01004864.1/~~gb/GECG01004864.1/.p1  ORF type:complete len:994 (+),score=141.05 gb/GECG01004864.1/:1-2982(+)